jgi:hypothetical protein
MDGSNPEKWLFAGGLLEKSQFWRAVCGFAAIGHSI